VHTRLVALLALALAPAAASLHGASAAPVRQENQKRADLAHLNLDESGLALSGYDPVGCFPEGGGKATKGSAEITLVQGGVTWRFASEKNRELFRAAPKRFEPAYGGWCAWAMVQGDKVAVDPTSFVIEDGRLLVFYDGFLADTRKKWLKAGGAALRPKADAAWTKIVAPPKGAQTATFHSPVEP
jgi:YHS domain-containing protein